MKKFILWGALMVGLLATSADAQYRRYMNLEVTKVWDADTVLVTPGQTNIWRYSLHWIGGQAADSVAFHLFISGSGDSVVIRSLNESAGTDVENGYDGNFLHFSDGPPVDSIRVYSCGGRSAAQVFFWY